MRLVTFLFPLVVLVGQALAQTSPPPAAGAGAGAPVVVKGASTLPITFDGHVSKFEYADATPVTVPNGHGTVNAWVKCLDGYLYFAFQIPDLSPFQGDDIVVMLDTAHDRSPAPDKNDIRAYVRRKMENSRQYQGDGKKWTDYYGEWEYRAAPYAIGWEVEVRIPLKAIGVDPTKPAALGLAFRIWDNEPQKTWNWPANSDENKPDTWATLQIQPAEPAK